MLWSQLGMCYGHEVWRQGWTWERKAGMVCFWMGSPWLSSSLSFSTGAPSSLCRISLSEVPLIEEHSVPTSSCSQSAGCGFQLCASSWAKGSKSPLCSNTCPLERHSNSVINLLIWSSPREERICLGTDVLLSFPLFSFSLLFFSN